MESPRLNSITEVSDDADEDNWTPLHTSAFLGDHETVVKLLRQRGSVTVRSSNVCKTLMLELSIEHDIVVSAFGIVLVFVISKFLKRRETLLAHATKADIDARDNEGSTALMLASLNGHVSIVSALLEHTTKADINAKDNEGNTALMLASYNGHDNVVSALLAHSIKADIDARDNEGYTSLMLASYNGHDNVVSALLAHSIKADIDARDNEGSTALMLASFNGHVSIVSALLEHTTKADINAKDNEGNTALMLASYNGHDNVVSALLAHSIKADIDARDNEGYTSLMLASYNGHDNVVSALLAHSIKADIDVRNIKGNTALMLASLNGHVSIVSALLEHTTRADIDARNNEGNTTLMLASSNGHVSIVSALLEHTTRADIDARNNEGNTALILASLNGHVSVVSALLAHTIKADIDAGDNDGRTALHHATSNAHSPIVELLIERGADMNKVDAQGITPVLVATCNNNIECLSTLLNHNSSDIDAKCMFNLFHGATALAIAASRGYKEIAEVLIEFGASVDVIDAFGCTPLQRAVEWSIGKQSKESDSDHLGVAELLIKSGRANVNALNFTGDTPLHLATVSNYGTLQTMKLLLDSGASINAQNSKGHTPLHCVMPLAIKSALYRDKVDFLVKNGADLYTLDCSGLTSVVHQWEILVSRRHLPMKLIEQMESSYKGSSVQESNQPIDYLNNTRLHYAVCCKALAMISNARSMVDFRLRTGGNLTVQNTFGHTPLHVTTAANLKHILKSENFKAETFLVKDKSGRTPLHTYFDKHFNVTKNESLQQLASRIKPEDKIQLRDLVNTPDDFGRIPLHYAAEVGHAGKLRYFLEGGSDCNLRDTQGRIPLHYAKTITIYNLLLAHTENKRVKDVDDLEPSEVIQMRQADGERSRRMKILRTGRFGKLQKYFKEPVRLMLKGIFNNPQFTSFRGQQMNLLHMFEPAFCAQVAVWKIWSEHDYALRDVVSHLIRQEVSDFMDRLVIAIEKQDPRFEGKPVLIGSAFEETKTNFPDEFDFNVVLTKFSQTCKVVAAPVVPKGFAYLKSRRWSKNNKELVYARMDRIEQDCVYDGDGSSSPEDWRHEMFRERDEEKDIRKRSIDYFFCKDGILKTYDVNKRFYLATQEVLSTTDFWLNEPIFKLDVTEIYQFYSVAPGTICGNIKLIVNKTFKGKHIFRKISVDVVPCFHIDGWWPEDAILDDEQAYKAEGCNLVIECPHEKYPWIPFSVSSTIRISFGPAESQMIKASHPVARAAYMVAKQIVGESRQSYALKTALLYCIEAARDTNHTCETINARDLCSWVRMILLCFLHFSLEDHIPCYFMPTFHLPFERSLQFHKDICRQSLKSAHLRLFGTGCQNEMDVEKMARCEAEAEKLVEGSVIHELMRSYFVYWFTCERMTDMEFCFPYPNPVSEKGLKREDLLRTLRASLRN